MRRLPTLLLTALLVATATYGVTYWLESRRPVTAATDQLAWLREEFHLTPDQFARVQALHAGYQPVCAGHCAQIMSAQSRLTALERAGKKDSPAYAAALKEWTSLKETCAHATFQHLQAVAAAMDSAEGQRYLALVTPRIAGHDHQTPQGLRP